MRCVDFVSVFDICTFKSFCRDFKTRTNTALINACLNSIEIHFLFGSRNITDISQSGRLTISLNFRNLCCTLLHFVFLLANKFWTINRARIHFPSRYPIDPPIVIPAQKRTIEYLKIGRLNRLRIPANAREPV